MNRAIIDGHTFEVDYEGANDDAEALVLLATRGAAYDDVPSALLKFEM